ncbi:uncharacterized protein N7473_010473 [Penicillium subrubescens]|uniref:uncharacterized protein n=1 Tax=Penicillium subrubescens TaxID=1316194 RepID=UPI0025456415|nr:uncharacterized protein N7473_010473 [Penicillium subrubescens]KAJ5883587.1 hypothetical protein N7473_010473 [Penicillium subrubescens]
MSSPWAFMRSNARNSLEFEEALATRLPPVFMWVFRLKELVLSQTRVFVTRLVLFGDREFLEPLEMMCTMFL